MIRGANAAGASDGGVLTQLPPLAMPYCLSELGWVVILLAIALDRRARVAPYLFGVLLVWHAIIGLWFLAKSAEPRIDVLSRSSAGARESAARDQPYAITFPDIYGPDAHSSAGHRGLMGRCSAAIFYWPMSLLLAVPGYLLGDARYTNFVSLTIASGLIAYARPSRISFLAASVVLFCPGIFLMLINAWIEPQMLMLICSGDVVPFGRPVQGIRVGGPFTARAFAGRGSNTSFTPAADRLAGLPQARGKKPLLIRSGAIAALSAAAIILPFFFWDPGAFLHSSRALYVNLIRTDAISVLAWLKQRFDIQLRVWV